MSTIIQDRSLFLPTTSADMEALLWDAPDFVYVSGDAYIDHPSFGTALLARLLEKNGYRVAILAQPNVQDSTSFMRFGRPKLGFLVSAGNLDSMVAHYSVNKKHRTYDYYSPGGKMGYRPDRACIVYCNKIREVYGDVPIIIGGVEASLRRFAHYDYWQDKMRHSILYDSSADLLSFGMGEKSLLRIAELLKRNIPIRKIRDVRGTVFIGNVGDKVFYESENVGDYADISQNKEAYARAFAIQYRNMDSVKGKAIIETYGDKMLVQNPPMPPLSREELDELYTLPFTRSVHPDYLPMGGVPAIEEVQFSITHNRGCFGRCNFCAITFHQGAEVRSRSAESVIKEAELLTYEKDFKGYIHDVGGPTANFRYAACEKQLTDGVCTGRKCLSPSPCKNMRVSHKEYADMLLQIEKIPGVKKVFVRSGIRFDYLLADPDDSFFKQLVTHHVSGQLKVAPEHCSNAVLDAMGKPKIEVFNQFCEKYAKYSKEAGKEQYLVPYLMSSHPGSTLDDAVMLASYLKKHHCHPEQVQDFYPTPGTVSTVMFYTGLNPLTMKPIYVTRDPHEKQMQRALLQWDNPSNYELVKETLQKTGHLELIGNLPNCLIPMELRHYKKKKFQNQNNRKDYHKKTERR